MVTLNKKTFEFQLKSFSSVYTCRYEMRSSGFHEEVRRHNELLRRRPSWQALLDYRTELEGASRRYRTSLTPHDEVVAAAVDDDDGGDVDGRT